MPATKEWTLMFYLASDNPLAISIVSQLKALKAAGYRPEVNVVAQFDPYTEGTPTHIFDVNLMNKLKNPGKKNIGFAGTDSFVRNLIEDKIWGDEEASDGKKIKQRLSDLLESRGLSYIAPDAPKVPNEPKIPSKSNPGPHNHEDEPDPFCSLQTFLRFCHESYPAQHYMLFIIGHGVVVGNDIFLQDEHAETQSITLNDMGILLKNFKEEVTAKGGSFELVSFHSCSVSSVEVAYELQDTANYMLASQGPTFVGSWPYRQILIRIFKELEPEGRKPDIEELLSDIFYYCLHNSSDFLLAGYSYQLTLCDLRRVSDLNKPIENLCKALVEGLTDAACRFIILFSHWRSQSFFQEMYTDLYDFCFCIKDRCNRIRAGQRPEERLHFPEKLVPIEKACDEILEKLARPIRNGRKDQAPRSEGSLIVSAEFAGPAYQYSRGLSVYFPWTQPSDDSRILQQYESYQFSKSGFSHSWLDFLKVYFEKTLRPSSRTELERLEEETKKSTLKKMTAEEELQQEIASLIYHGEGPLGFSLGKSDPSDRTGGDCDCLSFKNYARDTRVEKDRRRKAIRLPVSETLLGDF
jgi:Clostripain family